MSLGPICRTGGFCSEFTGAFVFAARTWPPNITSRDLVLVRRLQCPLTRPAIPLGLYSRNSPATLGSVNVQSLFDHPESGVQSTTCSKLRAIPLALWQLDALKLDEIGRAKGGSRGEASEGHL
jgi:hypothetical protein